MQALVGLFLFSVLLNTDPAAAIQVTMQNPFNTVILFQPVTFQCNYKSTSPLPPLVIWEYKSYCPSRQESQINHPLQQKNSSSNPNVECPDHVRTVRVVASKQGNSVALGDFYQGRRLSITNYADLTIEQTNLEDTGVYYCTVTSPQDLQGKNEAYAELLVLSTSLACETCISEGNDCSGPKRPCPEDQDTCMTVVLEGTAGRHTGINTVKGCYSWALCNKWKPGEIFGYSGVSGKIIERKCKA